MNHSTEEEILKKEKRRKVFYFIRTGIVSFLYVGLVILSLLLGFNFVSGGLVFKNYFWGVLFILLATFGLIAYLAYIFYEINRLFTPVEHLKENRAVAFIKRFVKPSKKG